MQKMRNQVLANGNTLNIAGKTYKSKYNECKSGFLDMAGSHINTGIILVPDNCNLSQDSKEKMFLAANYNADTDEEKQEINKIFSSDDSGLIQNLSNNGLDIE